MWSIPHPVSELSLTGQESVSKTPNRVSCQMVNHTVKLSSLSYVPLQYWSAAFFENLTTVSVNTDEGILHICFTSIHQALERSVSTVGPSLVSVCCSRHGLAGSASPWKRASRSFPQVSLSVTVSWLPVAFESRCRTLSSSTTSAYTSSLPILMIMDWASENASDHVFLSIRIVLVMVSLHSNRKP